MDLSSPRTSTVVLDIMGIINHHGFDNDSVEVYTSDYPFEYNSDYVPDLDTTPIKLIYDD